MLASSKKHYFQILFCRLWRYFSWYPRQALWCYTHGGFRFVLAEIRHKFYSRASREASGKDFV